MTFSAAQIAQIINGTVEGNPDASVQSFNKIEEAKQGDLAFLANPKYEEYLYTTAASVIIINQSLQLKHAVKGALIRVPDAYSAFATLLSKYQEIVSQQLTGIEAPSYIAADATVGEQVYVGAFAYIGKGAKIGNNVKIYPSAFIGNNVTIGDNTTIFPSVTIYHGCVIGKKVTIHAGTTIGGDGFGFAPQADGSFAKVPQMGNVVIEDDVEIGANATIDRATIGSTIIRKGAKIDNLTQIAHNVDFGSNSVMAAQAGISGSTKIGKNVMIGGQAGIVGHISIANGARINAQSGVSKSIKQDKAAVTGSPAYDYTTSLRSQAIFRKLPAMEKKIADLEALVKQLLTEKI